MISIDSLKIRIPFANVKVIDSQLTTFQIPALIDAETGEWTIEEESAKWKQGSLQREYTGYHLYFKVEMQQTAKGKAEKYLCILFSSKALEGRYLEGITLQNIRAIYERIIGAKVVHFSFEEFTKGEGTDIDFKRDFEASPEQLKEMLPFLRDATKPTKEAGNGVRLFREKNNLGAQWANRKTTATQKAPFLKVYHKGIELGSKSADFRRKYLPKGTAQNLARVETTVKNKRHFRDLGLGADTSLGHLLSLSGEEKERIIGKAVQAHLDLGTIVPELPNEGLTATERMVMGFIHRMAITGTPIELAVSIAKEQIGAEDRASRSRWERKLYQLYKGVQGRKELAKPESLSPLLNALGFG